MTPAQCAGYHIHPQSGRFTTAGVGQLPNGFHRQKSADRHT